MTSRPSSVPQQRPVQRPMGGTGIVQRPPPSNRSISQQYTSASAALTPSPQAIDLTFDVQARYATSRTGGSRLKQELTENAIGTTDVGSHGGNDVYGLPPAVEHPRGRPKMNFPPSSTTNPNFLRQNGPGTDLSPVPMPARPVCNVQPLAQRQRVQIPAGTQTKKEKEGPPKPYIAQVPPEAPRYPPDGHADFFPWTGNHPEDQFNDQIIKHGYYDRVQQSQNESGTAKAAIFPSMKHKTGLQALSSLLVGVLEHRRARGQITTPSTFKPPPRVTLTDTKRESWLRDLANPSIALRRLSRTIPHGIRGKVLLDQCLGKNIPTERAVWLAKCVGANEIRAFKRKPTGGFAMGGEAKWIRDWTAFVEQFVESVVSMCGEKDWKARMGYAVRLAAHLYSEHLLDREHYMDWLVASLENAGLAKLPVWLLITQVYWKDLLQFRKYGRRIVLSLLKYIREAQSSPDRDIFAPLLARLDKSLKDVLARNTKGFVLPNMWDQYRDTLRTCAGTDTHLNAILDTLEIRNSRLEATLALNKQSSAQSQLIRLLDATLTQPFLEDLPQRCMKLNASRASLVQTLLHWSTSPHRPGPTKIYVGARILRRFVRSGYDVDESILTYLSSDPSPPKCCKASLYHLISELARSGHFNSARYVQWLIARGGLRSATAFDAEGPCASRLLAELPIHNLTESLESLRDTLLDRAGFSLDFEAEALETAISTISGSLPNMSSEMDTSDETGTDLTNLLFGLNRSSRSELGLWLRQTVSEHVKDVDILSENTGKAAMAAPPSALDAYEFNIVRSVLERIEDFSMLADILKMAASSENLDVLASVADTLDLHSETFAAIGALRDLFDTVLVRFRTLAGNNLCTQKVLLASLARSSSRMSDRKDMAGQLAQELLHHDRKTAADACSPVSDYIAEALQKDAVDFADEVDKVLESGTSMDQPTMERLFQTIVIRLEASLYKSPEQQRSCGVLLSKLMTFDQVAFANLFSTWITQYLQTYDRSPLQNILGHLVSLGCVSMGDVLSMCAAPLDKDPASPGAARLAIETIVLLIGPLALLDVMTEEDTYRLRIKQRHFQKDNPNEVIAALRRAIERVCLVDELELTTQLDNICRSSQTTSFLQACVLTDVNTVSKEFVQPLSRNKNTKVSAHVADLVKHLLTSDNTGDGLMIEQILDLSDDLTMSFCQLQLHLLFSNTSSGNDESRKALIDSFDAAVVAVIARGNTSWTSIVPCLDLEVVRLFRGRAEDSFLKLFATRSVDGEPGSGAEAYERTHKLVNVLEATAYSIPPTGSPNLAANIVERLNEMWAALSTGAQREEIASKWLPLLLRLIIIHHTIFAPDKVGSELRARVLLSLTSLMMISLTLPFPPLPSKLPLASQIFDTALLLVDDLPDDARLACIRMLGANAQSQSVAHNVLVKYLFSIPTTEFEHLKLECKGKVSDFRFRRWEILSEPTMRIDGNDTSLSLTLFDARRG